MRVNNKTKLYVSISKNPGNTGARLHNNFFKHIKKNKLYLPLKIENLKNFIKFAKDTNIQGISISAPFKKAILKYLDKKDKVVKELLNCNTILNKNNKLYGYNTDYHAIYKTLKATKKGSVLILGSGAVAQTTLLALKKLKFKNIYLSSRKKRKHKMSNYSFLKWKDKDHHKIDILINATTLGMNIKKKEIINFDKVNLKSIKLIIDWPIPKSNSLTFLSKLAKENKIKYISGKKLAFLQGIKQCEIYNKIKLSKFDISRLKFIKI